MQALRAYLKLIVLLLLIAAAVYLVRYTSFGEMFRPEALQERIKSFGPGLSRVLYVTAYIVGTVLLVPGLLLSFVGAMLFGLWEATLYTWIGATIGATLCFFTARLLGRAFVDRLLKGKLRELDDRLRDRGFLSMLVLRLAPLFPFNGVNFGAGLTSIKPRDYLLATALGIIPGTFVYQYLFATLGRKVLDEGFSWRDLANVEVLAPLVVFLVFLVATAWLAKRVRKQATREEGSGTTSRKPPSEIIS